MYFETGFFMLSTRQQTINSWRGEWVYALVIDRFHDGKERTLPASPMSVGFGEAEDLRRTCGGTLNGIRLKLPYIKELGCTSILLTPFLENNSKSYHGYAIQDFLAVDARFGTLDELKALIHEAHELGLRVIMDVVLNHTGDNWSYKEKRTPYRKRKPYTFSHWHSDDKPRPVALRNEAWYSKRGHIVHWDNYPESWDGDIFELKDLVWEDNETGRAVLECMVEIYTYWIKEIGVDGFRLDALKHIRPVMANEFCRRIKVEADRLQKENFILIGEVVGGMELISQYTELHAFFNFPFYFEFLQGIKTKSVYEVFETYRSTDFLAVNYLDNHDQIGLEPKKRINDLLSEEQLLGSLFLMGLQEGIHCLYYGTEQGLQTKGEYDHDVRECLFDPYGSNELFNSNHRLFQRIKEVISLVREIKKAFTNFSRSTHGHLHTMLYEYASQEVYEITYNTSMQELETSHAATSSDHLIYSNYTEAVTFNLMRAFELRVYHYKEI
ncbi:MAG: amyA [Chitinophagaceae bacterium]|nr:amyA [Chitinophagaceae bacterium]